MTKKTLLLGASLLLNIVLVVLLIFSYQANQQEGQPAAQAPTEHPVVLIVTASSTPGPASSATSPPEPTVTPTFTPTATPLVPTATPTTATEATPTATAELAPTPEATSTTAPPAEPTPVPGPDWLRYANLFRLEANLPQLTENPDWSEGARLHSIYMVKTDQLWHGEDPASPWFTQPGTDAGENGNISASDWAGEAEPTWAIDYWISAPFHALPLLDPELHTVGYNSYREQVGAFVVAATIDIKRGQGDLSPEITYPLPFPRDGGQTWVLKHGLPEFPDPLTSCPGYLRPVGPPIVLQIGPGDGTPAVSDHSFKQGEQELEHCLFDETSYVNPTHQDTGRLLLDKRDAIVLMPRRPLEVGKTYSVSIVVNGETVSWSFEAVISPW